MQSKNAQMRLARVALLAFSFGAASCAAQNRAAGVQDIGMQWMAIERGVAQARLAEASGAAFPAGDGPCPIVRALDEFHKAARSFLDSGAYQAFRVVAHPPDFGAAAIDGSPEIADLPDLALSLRQAAMDGDWDRAMGVSLDISGFVAYAMIWDSAASQVIARVYFQLLLIFGGAVVIAGFAMRFYHGAMLRSQRREDEGSAFSRAVFLAQENERGALYRELHDTVAQDLHYLSFGISKIGKAGDGAAREKLCAEAVALHSGILGKVREICLNLAPPDLGIMDLPDALRRLCFNFSNRSGIECRANIAKNVRLDFLDRDKQIQFFRIAQEALANVEKHSRAAQAIVILRADADGGVTLCVSDDGEGFDPSDAMPADPARARMGIRSMRERAALLGGALTINSRQGEETLVHMRIPPPPITETAAMPRASDANGEAHDGSAVS